MLWNNFVIINLILYLQLLNNLTDNIFLVNLNLNFRNLCFETFFFNNLLEIFENVHKRNPIPYLFDPINSNKVPKVELLFRKSKFVIYWQLHLNNFILIQKLIVSSLMQFLDKRYFPHLYSEYGYKLSSIALIERYFCYERFVYIKQWCILKYKA